MARKKSRISIYSEATSLASEYIEIRLMEDNNMSLNIKQSGDEEKISFRKSASSH